MIHYITVIGRLRRPPTEMLPTTNMMHPPMADISARERHSVYILSSFFLHMIKSIRIRVNLGLTYDHSPIYNRIPHMSPISTLHIFCTDTSRDKQKITLHNIYLQGSPTTFRTHIPQYDTSLTITLGRLRRLQHIFCTDTS